MNNILKSINLRLSNPFILSFILSWIFWNWPIVIGLIWYNSETINLYGYENYKELIYANSNWQRNYLNPIVFSIAFPYLKLGFSAMQTFVNAVDERNIKKISGKGYIPTIKFLNLRDQFEKDMQRLSDVIDKESEVTNENSALKTSKIELEVELKKLKTEIKQLEGKGELNNRLFQVSSMKYLIGEWSLRLLSHQMDEINSIIKISEAKNKNKLSPFIGISDDESVKVEIYTYVFNPYSRKVALHISVDYRDLFEEKSVDDPYIYFGDLEWDATFTKLSGKDTNSSDGEVIELKKLNK